MEITWSARDFLADHNIKTMGAKHYPPISGYRWSHMKDLSDRAIREKDSFRYVKSLPTQSQRYFGLICSFSLEKTTIMSLTYNLHLRYVEMCET